MDLVQEVDSPDQGKVKSVMHIWTVDATMYDKGNGFDSADVVANGPGRLETQPDRGQPVERVAIWQDKLRVQNDVGSDGKVKRKMILLTGKRPCFIDKLHEASVDSAQWIKVFLEPKVPIASNDSDSHFPDSCRRPGRGQRAVRRHRGHRGQTWVSGSGTDNATIVTALAIGSAAVVLRSDGC